MLERTDLDDSAESALRHAQGSLQNWVSKGIRAKKEAKEDQLGTQAIYIVRVESCSEHVTPTIGDHWRRGAPRRRRRFSACGSSRTL